MQFTFKNKYCIYCDWQILLTLVRYNMRFCYSVRCKYEDENRTGDSGCVLFITQETKLSLLLTCSFNINLFFVSK